VAAELQALLDDANRKLLPLLARPDRRDAGALSNFVTYSRRLNDKLLSFARLSGAEGGAPDSGGLGKALPADPRDG
jgi:phosphate:Na+ symporter